MAIKIISADERLARPSKINIVLVGPSGVGKTTQARTLPPESTLFIDLEGGTLALQDWRGDVLDVRAMAAETGIDPWELMRAIACLLSGPDPSDPDGPYSREAHAMYAKRLAPVAEALQKYDTVFVDSITVAARASFQWAKRQPDAFSEKTGKPDTRGAYGLHGREMVRWLTVLQHTPNKSIIIVGILDKQVDDLGRVAFVPQIEGSKTGREMPGVFDQVITLEYLKDANGADRLDDHGRKIRAFYTSQDNPWGFPAKDRSGRLNPIEAPNLGELIKKIQTANRGKPAAPVTTIPAQEAD